MSDVQPNPARPERLFSHGERVGLIAAALATLVIQLDYLTVGVALPTTAHHFHRSSTDLQWVVSAFTLAFGAALTVSGWLTDTYGPRRVTAYGLAFFSASSLVCAFAPSVPWLVAGRALQGIGGAIVVPGAVAMISSAFEGRRKRIGLAFMWGVAGGGGALGPFIGGLLVAGFGWRSVFLFNLPLCLAAALLIRLDRTARHRAGAAAQRPPYVNAICVVAGWVTLTLVVDRGTAWGWFSAGTIVAGVGGVALLAAFAYRERRGPSLYSRALYGDRVVRLLTVVGSLAVVGFTLLTVFSMFLLQEARGLSPFAAGCVTLALLAPYAATTYAAGRLAGVKRVLLLLVCSMVFAGAAVLGLTFVSTPPAYAGMFALCGIGMGLGNGLTNLLVQQRVAAGMSGAAMSLTLSAKTFVASVAVALAATGAESLNGRVAGAAYNASALDAVLRACAAALFLGALCLAPRAIRRPGPVTGSAPDRD
ncbi:MFS transporter [Streptomyces sp. NPDC088729]|uniref:MFS transporter n=1 Tax=Streptomyces sp. NPDC088729 TaxID=3365876 RepID=UPI003817709E